MQEVTVDLDESFAKAAGVLFLDEAKGLSEQRAVRRASMPARVEAAARVVASEPNEPWLLWCEMNDEGDLLADTIPDSVQVAGADDEADKCARMLGFADGEHRVMVTKPKLAGFGLNWQHCNKMAFVGLSHSYEQFYQAIRRCWRFGQPRPVEVHVITTDVESEVLLNIERKQSEADAMIAGMVEHMSEITKHDIVGTERQTDTYRTGSAPGGTFTAHLGDCVEGIRALPDNSLHWRFVRQRVALTCRPLLAHSFSRQRIQRRPGHIMRVGNVLILAYQLTLYQLSGQHGDAAPALVE